MIPVRQMKATVEAREEDVLVRCRDMAKGSNYEGPHVSVWTEDGWIYVSTDEYEGTAMFNVEALGGVRRALAIIAERLKSKRPTP